MEQWTSKETTASSLSDNPGGRTTLRLLGDGAGGGKIFDGDGQFRKYHNNGDLSFAQIGYELSGVERVISPFSENPYVRAAIKAVSSGVCRLGFGLWDGDPKSKDSTEIESHPLRSLIRRPNSRQTEKQLWQAHVTAMKLTGESFWFMADKNGGPTPATENGVFTRVPAQIIQVSGDKVQIDYDKAGFPSMLRYTVGKSGHSSAPFPYRSVVHFYDFNPDDETRGLGDAESAVRAIDLQHQITRYLDASLRNGGAPSGMLIFKDAIAPEELERRQAEADDDNAVENAGRIKVVDRDATFTPNTFTPKDFEYEALWDGMTSTILTAMGVPEPVVGIYNNATYENVRTAYIEFWRGSNGVLALAGSTTDVLTNSLIPRLRRVWPTTKGMTAHFDHSSIEVLAEDFADEFKLASEIAKSGIGVSFNEVLTLFGLAVGQPETGDRHFVGQGFTDDDSGKFYGPPQAATGTEIAQKLRAAYKQMKNEVQ